MKTAFIGLGKMGSAIARLLIKSGEDVTVWNRTPSRGDELGRNGARVANTAAEAVAGAEVVFTMLMDDASLREVLEDGEVLESISKGAIHVSMSTLSVAYSKKLTNEHAERGQHFVAAPVFGRPHIAEAGKLWIAMGGTAEAVRKVRPLLEKCSRGISVVGEHPWSAHALKLGGNFLITAMIASLSEAIIYAEAEGIEGATFLDTVNKALFQSPFYEMYGKIMLTPPETPGATMAVGEKDMRLFREAASAEQVRTPLAEMFLANFHRAFEVGMKDADWASGYLELQRGAGKV
jgi:3-hydroxyisobutyrate dehydrogenase-like beta-hydroxyacid dehydrogenase